MANNSKSKLEFLYIKQILETETDEDHSLSMSQIVERLDSYDIFVERKGVYRYINTLRVLDKPAVCNETITHHTFDADEYESFARFRGSVAATLLVDGDKVVINIAQFGDVWSGFVQRSSSEGGREDPQIGALLRLDRRPRQHRPHRRPKSLQEEYWEYLLSLTKKSCKS